MLSEVNYLFLDTLLLGHIELLNVELITIVNKHNFSMNENLN